MDGPRCVSFLGLMYKTLFWIIFWVILTILGIIISIPSKYYILFGTHVRMSNETHDKWDIVMRLARACVGQLFCIQTQTYHPSSNQQSGLLLVADAVIVVMIVFLDTFIRLNSQKGFHDCPRGVGEDSVGVVSRW